MPSLLAALAAASANHPLHHSVTPSRHAALRALAHPPNTRLPSDPDIPSDPQARLLSLLAHPSLALPLAIVSSSSQAHYDDIIHIVLSILDSHNLALKFVYAIIEKEVSDTEYESLLFRGNSLATRILTCFARTHGYHFLREILRDLLLTLCRQPREFSLDFDPHSATHENDIGTRNLEAATESFLHVIISHWTKLPKSIRDVCHFMSLVVAEKFPNSVFTSIGGFIFLRFINPAIIQPESIDLDLPTQSRELRRGLIMITKILQALANNIRFGPREPGMRALNEFMLRNIFPMTRYLGDISRGTPTNNDELEETDNFQLSLNKYDQETFHRYLHHLREKISKELLSPYMLQSRQWHDGAERFSMDSQRYIKDCFDSIMDKWKLPENEKPIFNDISVPEDVFFESNWSTLIYETSMSKDDVRTFYFEWRELDVPSVDFESLANFIIKLFSTVENSFNLFIDCTLTNLRNEPPLPWIHTLFSRWPTNGPSLKKIYLFSPTLLSAHSLKRILSQFEDHKLWKRVVPLFHPVEFDQHFNFTEPLLHPKTVSLLSERRLPLTNVVYVQKYLLHAPVYFFIGDSTIMAESVKPIELGQDVRSKVRTFIPLKDIKEAKKLSQSAFGDAFIIRMNSDGSEWSFVDQRFERYNLTPIDKLINKHRQALAGLPKITELTLPIINTVSETSVVPSMFNSALINLCSLDASVRETAYGLLVSLVSTFQLSALDGLSKHVPSVNLNFLAALSESLSGAVPHFAIDFLECALASLQNCDLVQAISYLNCLQPWFQTMVNNSTFGKYDAENISKRKTAVVEGFVMLGFENILISQCMQMKIWPCIAKSDDLCFVVMTSIIDIAASEAYPLQATEHALSSLVSMQSFGMRPKIFAMARKAISAASERRRFPLLSMTMEWGLITAQIRADFELSFLQGRGVQLVVPDVLHMVILLAGIGPSWFCNIVYNELRGLINALGGPASSQSLSTATAATFDMEVKDRKSGEEAGVMGRGGKGSKDGPPSIASEEFAELNKILASDKMKEHFQAREGSEDELLNRSKFDHTVELVALIQRLLRCGAASMDTENMWKSRLVSLLTRSSFEPSPKLQERAFLALGQMCEGVTDEDLMYQCFVTFGKVIESMDDHLGASVLCAIVQMGKGLSCESEYCVRGFWVGMVTVQLELVQQQQDNGGRLLSDALSLIEVTLMRTRDVDNNNDVQVVFGEGEDRTNPNTIDGALREVVETGYGDIGVRFEPWFSFALGGILLRCGLRFPSERDKIVSILKECLWRSKSSRGGVGYKIGLLLLEFGLRETLGVAGVEYDEGSTGGIMEYLQVPKETDPRLLTCAMIVYAFMNQEDTSVICSNLLMEAATNCGDILRLFNEYAMDKYEKSASASDDVSIRNNAKAVIYMLRSTASEDQQPNGNNNSGASARGGSSSGTSGGGQAARPFLEMIGFGGLVPIARHHGVDEDEARSTECRRLISKALRLNC